MASSGITVDNILGSDSSFSNMSAQERDYFTKLVQEEMFRREESSKPIQIRDVVPIEQWINSEYYVGPDVSGIYPYWKDVMVDVFREDRKPEEKVNQVILSGCFTGDTKVSLLDGRELSFIDLVEEYGTNKHFWVYSCDSDGNVVPGKAHNVRKTKVADKIIKITLDSGESIECTLDHRFLKRDNTYCRADNLKVGDSLMPLYRSLKNQHSKDRCKDGYERYYNPADGKYYMTHSMVSRNINRDAIDSVLLSHGGKCVVVTHHYDFNKRNNTPENLIPMEMYEHYRLHHDKLLELYKDPIKSKDIREKFSKRAKAMWNNPDMRKKILDSRRGYVNSAEYLKGHWKECQEKAWAFLRSDEGKKWSSSNLYNWNNRIGFTEDDVQRWKDSIGKASKAYWDSDKGAIEKRVRSKRLSEWNLSGNSTRILKAFWNSDKGKLLKEKRAKQYADKNRLRAEGIIQKWRDYYVSLGITIDGFSEVVKRCKTWGEVARELNKQYGCSISTTSHMNTFLKCFNIESRKSFTDSLGVTQYVYKNHKVAYIEIIDKRVDVYDLEVDEYHNFALTSGVYVHNSIGIGKSTVAELMMLRKLYEMSCWKNINARYKLLSKTNIMFIYFSVNKVQAERTGFGEMRSWIDSCPYFAENFPRHSRIKEALIFPEGLSFVYGSGSQHSIGMSVIGTIMDEANFMGANGAGDVEKASELYAGIVNRANSRFIIDGGVNHSLNILISSATHESSVTERQIALSKDDPHTYISAPSQWEVKPDKFSKKFFYVCKGTDYLEPHIVNSTDDVNNFILSEGLQKVKYVDGLEDVKDIEKVIDTLPNHLQAKFLKVPVDLKRGFEANIMKSLQDLGGVSVSSSGKLFSSVSVYNACINDKFRHPFIQQSITISTGDQLQISDFLRQDFRLKYPERPRYIHIDQSYRTDDTGISCVYVDDVITDENGTKKPVFGVDFMLQINPPKPPKKIAIYKIRNFVVWLSQSFGMKIGKVTYDIFNSEESRQILEEMGFNVAYQSVDRTDKAYLDLVEIMYEGRLRMYDYPIFRQEIFNVVHYRDKRKVDHLKTNPDGCLLGNTEIRLLNGKVCTIESLVGKSGFEVYGCDSAGSFVPARVSKVWKTKEVLSYYRITLDNGKVIECTENHPIMLRDGTYCRADKLVSGLFLMSLGTTYIESHRVVDIDVVKLLNPISVYDMEVPATHNFALNCGVYVHNSIGKKDVADSLAASVESALQFKIDTISGGGSHINDFLRANMLDGAYEYDAMTAEEMVDRQIEQMIEELEGGDTGFNLNGLTWF